MLPDNMLAHHYGEKWPFALYPNRVIGFRKDFLIPNEKPPRSD
ncbi:hypothetical protein DEV91_112106 [Phyllobacterium brassicacearum]|nr:hypothetical protein DEV91_112106 [Phyllobacterium brassicacearum]